MRTTTSALTQRLTAARRTVDVTRARLRNAHTSRERDELEGVLDRAMRALRHAERDVAVERAGAEFCERLAQASRDIEAERGGET